MDFENVVSLTDVITASSWKPEKEPELALIRKKAPEKEFVASWSPEDDDKKPYLEVRFPSPIKVTSLITKGGENGEFVPKFTLKTSSDVSEKPVDIAVLSRSPSGEMIKSPKVFNGNNDDHTLVRHVLEEPITVVVIRIYPIRSEPDSPISLKIEIRGCLVEESTTVPAIVETTSVKEIRTTKIVETEDTTAAAPTRTTSPIGEMTTSKSIATSPVVVETTTTVTKVVTPVAESTTASSTIPSEILTKTTTKEVAKTTSEVSTSAAARTTTSEIEVETALPQKPTLQTERTKLCDDAMGIEYGITNVILQPKLSASTNLELVDQAKLNFMDKNGNPLAWKPTKEDNSPWISVTFQHPVIVTSLLIQGSGNENEFITEVKVEYSLDGEGFWHPVENKQTSEPKLFNVNVRGSSIDQIIMPEPLQSVKSLKIVPVSWNRVPALRLEVKGCYALITSTTETTTKSDVVTLTTLKASTVTTEKPFQETTDGVEPNKTTSFASVVTTTAEALPTTHEVIITTTSASVLNATEKAIATSSSVTASSSTSNSFVVTEPTSTNSRRTPVSSTTSSAISTTTGGVKLTTAGVTTTAGEKATTAATATTLAGMKATTASEKVTSSDAVTTKASIETTTSEKKATTSFDVVDSFTVPSTTAPMEQTESTPAGNVETTVSSKPVESTTVNAVVTTTVGKAVTTKSVTDSEYCVEIHIFFYL